jgi:hypothetical protein
MGFNPHLPLDVPEFEASEEPLNWKSEPTTLPDTVQFTDNYVRHGRGFTIGADIWFDEYALYSTHMYLYNEHMRSHYDKPEYEDSWPAYVDEAFADEPIPLYWSVTGNGAFTLQHPRSGRMDVEAWQRLYRLLETLEAPSEMNISVHRQPPETGSAHARSILRAMDSDVDKSVSFTADDLRAYVEQ